jgi:hypothetical protein
LAVKSLQNSRSGCGGAAATVEVSVVTVSGRCGD